MPNWRTCYDLDNDGVNDAGEPAVSGASVSLTGAATKTVTTNASGHYTTGAPILPAGSYSITASKVNYTSSTPAATANPAAGANAVAGDFGLHFQTGTVSGDVYAETNGTPGRQSDEPPIGGATVTVSGTYDGQAFSLPTQSQADGTYSLAVFAGTNRTVTESQPGAYADGPEFTAVAGPVTGAEQFSGVTVTANTATGAFQFGETGATISGVTFSDRDAQGIRDAGEPGIGGRTIAVTALGFSASVTSAPDGTYVVSGLPAGDVTLTPNATVDALAPVARMLQPGVAATLADQNFGYRFTSLAGTVVNRQTGEAIAGATVSLSGSASQTTTTAADGSWSFFDLTPGTYAVHATAAGFDPATSTAGNLGGAGEPGGLTGIGAGLGEHGTGYGLGLTPGAVSGGPGAGTGEPGAGTVAKKTAKSVKIIAGKRTSVRKSRLKLGCKVDAGVLRTCSFVVRDKRGKVLARGKGTAKKPATGLTVALKLTKLGKRLLGLKPRGLAGKAALTATQATGPKLTARKTLKLRRS